MLLMTDRQQKWVFKELNIPTGVVFGLNIVATAAGCVDHAWG